MVINKKYLPTLFKALRGTENILNLADSRIRDEFLKKLGEPTSDFENAQQVIYKQFCLKNEDGTPDAPNGVYQFPKTPETVEAINKELTILLEEEVDLEVKNPEKIKEFLGVTDFKPLVGEAEILDIIISKIE